MIPTEKSIIFIHAKKRLNKKGGLSINIDSFFTFLSYPFFQKCKKVEKVKSRPISTTRADKKCSEEKKERLEKV